MDNALRLAPHGASNNANGRMTIRSGTALYSACECAAAGHLVRTSGTGRSPAYGFAGQCPIAVSQPAFAGCTLRQPGASLAVAAALPYYQR